MKRLINVSVSFQDLTIQYQTTQFHWAVMLGFATTLITKMIRLVTWSNSLLPTLAMLSSVTMVHLWILLIGATWHLTQAHCRQPLVLPAINVSPATDTKQLVPSPLISPHKPASPAAQPLQHDQPVYTTRYGRSVRQPIRLGFLGGEECGIENTSL